MLLINKLFRQWDNGLLSRMVEWKSVFLLFRLLRSGCHYSFVFSSTRSHLSSWVFSSFWSFLSGGIVFPDGSAFPLFFCKLLLNKSCFCPRLKSREGSLKELPVWKLRKKYKSAKTAFAKERSWSVLFQIHLYSGLAGWKPLCGWMLLDSIELMCCVNKVIREASY